MLAEWRQVALVQTIRDLLNAQGGCGRTKNTPFPRQFAFFSFVFVWVFAAILPLGLVEEFDSRAALGQYHALPMVPFSVLVSGVFDAIEAVGHTSEGPFENDIYDVPMTSICLNFEINIRERLLETGLPSQRKAVHDVLYDARPAESIISRLTKPLSMRESIPEPANDLPNPMEAALLRNIAEFYQHQALAAQISRCQVTLREYSGCGFFTTLAVPADSPLIISKERFFGGSDVEAPELSHGAGSILFVKNGLLDFLEVFAYVDGDPADLGSFALRPISPTIGAE